ncbi:MAG TPA: ribbon-helix-helix protein, CopG family [Thermoanaerobaculia bacterium]|nr:ribbon-helix-helix protein, CopG family [Thermoanaerobaculia bacterium]
MIRTLISLEDEDKRWLDRRAKEEGVTMAHVVRKAVSQYREQCERDQAEPSLEDLLRRTSGLWKGGDGLEAQLRLREEWEEER